MYRAKVTDAGSNVGEGVLDFCGIKKCWPASVATLDRDDQGESGEGSFLCDAAPSL